MMDTSDEENEAVADTSALVPWTNQDSSDMEIDVNEPKLQDCIETENLSLVNSTINTSSNNVILQEEINQIETVLEFQHGNCEQLGIQHETLCADSGHETKMRENLLRMVDHSRQTSKLLEDALKRAAVAYDARVAGREYLSAATASAACALSASAARRVQREKAYRDELSSMQQEVNNLTKRKNELTDIAENLTKFEEERREEYARNFEKLNKEMENMESEGEELEKLNKELQKNLAEMDSQYMDLNMEIKTVQGEYESEKKELTEKILLQEKILTEQHKEKASLKARIASQEQLVKATTAECVSYEERLIILEESCNKTDVRPEEEEELVISLETRLRNLTALSNDNDQISKKQFQNIQDLLKKLTTIQEETRKIIDIRLAKELEEVDTVKRRDEKALLLDQLKEAKRKHHIKETLQRNIEHKKIGLLENISKAEIELTMLAENYELFYSNLIGEKNWKSEKLAFTVKRVEELDQKLGVAYCNLNIQKQINADHVSEIEKIDTQLTDIFLKNDRTLLEHSNIITTLKNGKEELQKKIEELNKLTGDSELMDTDLKLKLQSSIEEQESLHKEIACLKLEAQAKVEILEEINRNYQEKKIELEKQMNDQRLQHESKTSALLKENTEIEMRLDNENKTISKLVSEIKKNIDMKSTIEVDIENYHKEIKSVTDAITIKNTNLATAVKEKENDRKEKTKKNENVYRRLKKNTSENI